jgi:hypothetical protein
VVDSAVSKDELFGDDESEEGKSGPAAASEEGGNKASKGE